MSNSIPFPTFADRNMTRSTRSVSTSSDRSNSDEGSTYNNRSSSVATTVSNYSSPSLSPKPFSAPAPAQSKFRAPRKKPVYAATTILNRTLLAQRRKAERNAIKAGLESGQYDASTITQDEIDTLVRSATVVGFQPLYETQKERKVRMQGGITKIEKADRRVEKTRMQRVKVVVKDSVSVVNGEIVINMDMLMRGGYST